MKTLLVLLLLTTIFSCENTYDSKFFNDCSCNQIEMTDKIIEDSLAHFSIALPKGNWRYSLNLDSNGNGISISDNSSETIKMFTITELEKSTPWRSKEQQLQSIQNKFDVIKHGKINLFEGIRFWHLVKDDSMPNLYVLYITVEHKTDNRFATLAAWVEHEDFKSLQMCELESIINSFQYNN